ncbi:uncharacterized protein LOC103716932 [Phoenix dactylifera]|uniref:Uncharacterized protein LOC103716932 n=1 Tax=Phoenix dactylifera TaxID=42345 RepID=A0A8B7CP54_PHODC|nr:uncharacterized protein LOC103716932 [Phoenix dactylifera]
MGNGLSPCFCSSSNNSLVKLVFWGGATKFLTEKQLAGELMFQFPDCVVCHADSFYIGQPVPVLSIGDELHAGETYFVIPVDRFPCNQILTPVTLASFSPGPTKPSLASFGQCPFEYVKAADGRTVIKVQPKFIAKVITAEEGGQKYGRDGGTLCSTPELKKHYAQLVGSRDRPWSPKLETISESKSRLSQVRLSPVRLFGLEKRSG